MNNGNEKQEVTQSNEALSVLNAVICVKQTVNN